jgi:hypothetical protein
MANELDGFAALRRIGKHADTFPDVIIDSRKAARMLVAKQLKPKSAGVETLRKVRKAIGGKTFRLIVDGMTDADVTALVAKFDPHHPELKTASPAWRRGHIAALADGEIEPVATQVVAPKDKAPRQPMTAKPPERLDSLAMAAVRNTSGRNKS